MTYVPFSGKLTSLAGRYAKTLFDLAQESGNLTEIYQELTGLCQLISKNEELLGIVNSPALTRSEHQLIFQTLSEKLNLSKVLSSFLDTVSENRRLDLIFEIQEIFQEMVDAIEGLTHIDVVSSSTLTPDQQMVLQKILSDYTAGDVAVTYILNPDLLGGILVRMGNQVVDLSLATKLQNLAIAMKGRA
ncbi:MAG: ATP synthase F1 subunit delta [Candidatus Paracaedibacteraceae bacterium]|nr:ATP synthase F1 subunit delta [Candidatus Paracaedibacteraceae bacterium]